jgi:archaeal type IV pilus assembly protein PilA
MKKEAKESAVSEVIGVILIVALTVILAAIIGAYAFGWMQGIPMSRTVVLTADQPDASNLYITYRGGPDYAILTSITIMWPDGVTRQTVTNPKIGEIFYATNGAGPKNVTSGNDHVVVTGHFMGNYDQVVLDTLV